MTNKKATLVNPTQKRYFERNIHLTFNLKNKNEISSKIYDSFQVQVTDKKIISKPIKEMHLFDSNDQPSLAPNSLLQKRFVCQ